LVSSSYIKCIFRLSHCQEISFIMKKSCIEAISELKNGAPVADAEKFIKGLM
jgi:hypothetical protein